MSLRRSVRLACSGQGRPCLDTVFASGSWPTVGGSLCSVIHRGSLLLVVGSSRIRPSPQVVRRRRCDGAGRTATQHVNVTPPKANDRPASLPPSCRVPREHGGRGNSHFLYDTTRAVSSPRIRLGPELHADVPISCLLVEGGLGFPTGRFSAPLHRSCRQPPTFSLW